jgi:endonuclease/exonuclease/phosphatase family metal-dependent hydrolase
MPAITDSPPRGVAEDLSRLRAHLDATIPRKRLDDNLLIGTWNIRAFGDLTEKWRSGEGDSPKRDLHALLCIKEICSRFDVVALQEVKGNIKSLRHMLKALGDNWAFLITDVTRGRPGNDERMAFLFDTRRVKPSGLACELVVPPEWLAEVHEDALTEQFARTPYAASFRSEHQTFILITLHVLYGKTPADRIPELKAIARWMGSWAEREEEWRHNLIVLGDFNIDRAGDPAYEAFTSTGLFVDESFHDLPRTIFGAGKSKHYDQIAWFLSGTKHLLTLDFRGGGNFDFVGVVLTDLEKRDLSWRISDHYPLWAEFRLTP